MTAAIDWNEIERMRCGARSSGILREITKEKPGQVPDLLSCVFDEGERVFHLQYDDLSCSYVAASELRDIGNQEIVFWAIDEYKRGVFVVAADGSVSSFSAEFPRYLRDPSYRNWVDSRAKQTADGLATRVAARVRMAREALGLSVTDLARRMGMAAPNVHRIEAGRHLPSTATLVRLAKALELSLGQLVSGNED